MTNKETLGLEKKSGNILNNISHVLPIGYVFLVFCGALYFYFYYLPFNIDIFRYLELSEIAVSFLPIMISIVMYLGYVAGYFVLIKMVSLIMEKASRLKLTFLFMKLYNFLKGKEIYFTFIMCCICAGYLFLSYKWLSVEFKFTRSGEMWWNVFLFLSILTLFLIVETKHLMINLAILFIMLVVHEAIDDFRQARDSAEMNICTIITDRDTIITNGANYFVGRTNNYIFLYNEVESTNTDVPVNQIKKFSFKNIRQGEKLKFWKDLKNKISARN